MLHLEHVELPPKVEQQLRVEAGADLAGEDEVLAVEVAHEQRAEADARSLRVGKPADDKLLRRLALHLEPVARAAVLVPGVAALGDDALPALAAGALPRLRAAQPLDKHEGRRKGQLRRRCAAVVEWQLT